MVSSRYNLCPSILQAPPLADGEENTDPEAEAILADRPSKVVVTDYTVCSSACIYIYIQTSKHRIFLVQIALYLTCCWMRYLLLLQKMPEGVVY